MNTHKTSTSFVHSRGVFSYTSKAYPYKRPKGDGLWAVFVSVGQRSPKYVYFVNILHLVKVQVHLNIKDVKSFLKCLRKLKESLKAGIMYR